MSGKTEKQIRLNTWRTFSEGASCGSVLQRALKMLGAFEGLMKNKIQKDYQVNRTLSDSEIGYSWRDRSPVESKIFTPGVGKSYGASGIGHGSPNCSKSLVVPHLGTIFCSTFMGFSNRSFAVRIIVMIKNTFRLPCDVMLPKVIFLNKTVFLIALSAALFERAERTMRVIAPVIRKIKAPNPHLYRLSACTEEGKNFHISGNCESRTGDWNRHAFIRGDTLFLW